MGVTNDYIITRAVGMRTHLFDTLSYEKLCSFRSISEIIDEMNQHGYDKLIAKYYSSSNSLQTLSHVIFESIDERWRRIVDFNHNEFARKVNSYRQLIDFRNFINLFMLQQTEKKENKISEFISKLMPGGTIKYYIWENIFDSNEISEIKSKTYVLASDLSDFVSAIRVSEDLSSFLLLEKVITKINKNALQYSKNHLELTLDPITILQLDIINKFLIRFASTGMKLNRLEHRKLRHLLEPWGSINWLLKNENFASFNDNEDLIEFIHLSLENEWNQLSRENPALIPTFEFNNWEAVVTFKTLHLLSSHCISAYNEYLVVLILFQIVLEGKNLIWAIFCVLHNVDRNTMRGGLIYQ